MELRELGKQGKQDCKLQMTPMIDVVFLLLVFFMCTIKFKTPDHRLDANMPKNKGQIKEMKVPKMDEAPDIKVRIQRVDAPQGSMRARFIVGRDRIVPLGQLAGVIKDAYKDISDNAAHHGKKIPVVIDGDSDVDFGYIVAALNACKAAKVPDVEFAAPPMVQ